MANIIEITDFSAPELDVYARLTENQLVNRERPEEGPFHSRKSDCYREGSRRGLQAGIFFGGDETRLRKRSGAY